MALGDLDRDGYDDLGISRQGETNERASLEVFWGRAGTYRPGRRRDRAAPRRSVNPPHAAGEPGGGLHTIYPLYATSGDFDLNGRLNLAIGEPVRRLTDIAQKTLDAEERGHVYVLWDVADHGSEQLLCSADLVTVGEEDGDQLGWLPSQPAVDWNGDLYPDLLVGATRADVYFGELLHDAGKTYLLAGCVRPIASLQGGDPQVLSNDSVAGSGNFVTGQFGPLTLEGGTDRWFEFTTLGDGAPVRMWPCCPWRKRPVPCSSGGQWGRRGWRDGSHERPYRVEGDVRPQWVMELDLGTLLPYMAAIGTESDPLTALQLQLDYFDFAQALPYDSSMPLSSPPIALNGKLIFPSQRIRLCSKRPVIHGRYGHRNAHRVLFGRIAGHPQPHMADELFYFTADDGSTGWTVPQQRHRGRSTTRCGSGFGFSRSNPTRLTPVGDSLYFLTR